LVPTHHRTRAHHTHLLVPMDTKHYGSLVVVQCSNLLYKAHRSHSYEMVCGYKFFIGAPRQGHRRTRGGNVPSWRTLEGKLSNPRGRATHPRDASFFSSKIYEIPRAWAAWGAMRQFPIAQLDSRRTVGGQTRGVVARVWYTCGTPIWAWHVATRVCRACEARGWFI
jgi:hypothetical protein